MGNAECRSTPFPTPHSPFTSSNSPFPIPHSPFTSSGLYQRMKFAQQHGLQALGMSPVYFLSPFDFPVHQVLTAIRLNTSVAKLRDGDTQPTGFYFHSPEEIDSLFAPFPELIANTIAAAAQCNFEFALG